MVAFCLHPTRSRRPDMKKIEALWSRWKIKHGDKSMYTYDGGAFGMLASNSSPLRTFWDKHGTKIKKALIWLYLLTAGGVITKFVGLA